MSTQPGASGKRQECSTPESGPSSKRSRRRRHGRSSKVTVDRFERTESPQVQVNMRNQAAQAHQVCDDPFFLSVVREGFRIQWNEGTRPNEQWPYPKGKKLTKEVSAAFSMEHQRLRDMGVSRWVRSADQPAKEAEWIHPVFAIWQGTKWRSIYNMRDLNKGHLRAMPFKMTGVGTWKSLIHEKMYMASIDIQDAYLHISVHPDDVPFQRYIWEGQVWEITTLPFGLAQAPFAFTKFLDPLLRKWRAQHNIEIISWIDDLILGHMDKAHLQQALQQILDDLSRLGIKVNTKPGKSVLQPTQSLTWCGVDWNSRSQKMFLPKKRRVALLNAVKHALRTVRNNNRDGATGSSATGWLPPSGGGYLPLLELATLLGKIQSTAETILPQRAFSSELVRDMAVAVRKSPNFRGLAWVNERSLDQLRWWKENITRWNGISWAKEWAAHELTTDASPWAWGAILRTYEALSGQGTSSITKTSGFFTPEEAARSQNVREALAVRFGYLAFERTLLLLRDKIPQDRLLGLIIRQDNSSVVAYIRRQGGRKKRLGRIIEELIRRAFSLGIHLLAVWIPGSEIEADPLSRELSFEDQATWETTWTLYRRVVKRLSLQPAVDLFASRLNTKCSHYYSWRPDPGALDFDALSQEKDWSALGVCWAAPPTKLIPKAIAKAERDQATVIFVVPDWPTAPWTHKLLSLARAAGHQTWTVTLSRHTVTPRTGENPLQWHGGRARIAVVAPPQRAGSR